MALQQQSRVVSLAVSGARGESFGDQARRIGSVGSIQILPTDSDSTILNKIAAAAAPVQEASGPFGDGLVVTDPAGDVLLRITPLLFQHPVIDTLTAEVEGAGVAAAAVQSAAGQDKVVITDPAGYVLMEISPDALRHPQIETLQGEVDGILAASPDYSAVAAQAEMVHIVCYGQSLATGQDSGAALTTTPLAYAKRFTPGVRYVDADTGGTADATLPAAQVYPSIEPFYEQNDTYHLQAGDGGYNVGETPLGGCIEMIHQLLLAEDGVDLAGSGQSILGSCPAEGGMAISALATTYFPRVTSDFEYGASLSAGAGETYAPGAMIYIQGEADYGIGTLPATYLAAVRALRQAAEAAAQAGSGLSRPLPMVTYQTSTHLYYNVATPGIALQQLIAASDEYISMACPSYFLPYANQLHLTATGYKWMGAYMGLALKRWLWDGIKPAPLALANPFREGASVLVRVPLAPGRKLVADTTTVTNPGNLGFTLQGPSGAAIAVASAAVVGRNVIRVTAASAIPAGSQLNYAWIGDSNKGVGCIRDNAGDSLVFDPTGINKPMHNWLPICSLELP